MTDLNKEREVDTLPGVAHLLEQCKHRDLTLIERAFVKGARYAWQEKAKAQAVPEKKIYLTCEQLYAAANFGAPNKDPELLETELTIAWFDEAHSGSGYYVYISEYPEEGAMKLESESGAEK
ncbi:hypothetical protein [Acinetobacter baumannii]|uniref:hypothetical protein n=1 Tax=Acinetobacter baumannii TaxID=470 RepID=UPI0038921B03